MKRFTLRAMALLAAILTTSIAAQAQTPFWSEGFSGGGVPAGWTNTDDNTPVTSPTEIVLFQWANDPAAVEPASLGFAGSASFNSSDASNGYLWANSDRGLGAAPPQNHLTRLTTSALDCSAQSEVWLQFDALIGVFDFDAATNAIVRVSSDGVNWTDFTAFPCLVTGAAAPPCVRWSANPDVRQVNISSVAAGQANVFIQFQWDGGWEYFWAIDKVELYPSSPIPANNLAIESFFYPASSYSQPVQCIATDTMGFFAFIKNVGSATQSSIELTAKVLDGAVVLFEETVTSTVAIEPDSVRAIQLNNTFIPVLLSGLYNIEYSVAISGETDADMSNNTGSEEFAVTAGTFAKENDVTTAYTPGGGGDYHIGNLYRMSPDIIEDFRATTVTWSSAVNTADPYEGKEVEMLLLKILDVVDPDFANFQTTTYIDQTQVEVVGSLNYTHTATDASFDLFTGQLIDFNTGENNVTLEPGARYFLMANYVGNANTIFHGFNESINYLNSISTVLFSTQWFLGGFGDNVAAVLRMDLAFGVNTDEIALADGVVKVTPTLASNEVNVALNLATAQAATVTMADINGKVIDMRNIANAQFDAVRFDVSNLPTGTYLVRLATNEGTKTQKISVQH